MVRDSRGCQCLLVACLRPLIIVAIPRVAVRCEEVSASDSRRDVVITLNYIYQW
jgi:hypothetical protein